MLADDSVLPWFLSCVLLLWFLCVAIVIRFAFLWDTKSFIFSSPWIDRPLLLSRAEIHRRSFTPFASRCLNEANQRTVSMLSLAHPRARPTKAWRTINQLTYQPLHLRLLLWSNPNRSFITIVRRLPTAMVSWKWWMLNQLARALYLPRHARQ